MLSRLPAMSSDQDQVFGFEGAAVESALGDEERILVQTACKGSLGAGEELLAVCALD